MERRSYFKVAEDSVIVCSCVNLKTYGRMDLRLHSINYALDGGNWLTSFRNCVIFWWPLDRMMSGLQT